MCLKKESKMKKKVYSPPSRWKVIVLTGLTFVCMCMVKPGVELPGMTECVMSPRTSVRDL